MKINILITYRPLVQGGCTSAIGPVHQLPDGRWKTEQYTKYGNRFLYSPYYRDEDELIQAIKFLNKNSYFKHPITVIIDNDVYPNENYLKEFDNVKILKSKYVHNGDEKLLIPCRLNAADIEGINSIPDEEWLCYAYQSDFICSKDWDKYIIDEIQRYGEGFVYVPMFTEIILGTGPVSVKGLDPTPERIWDEWRRTVCCHALTMPFPRSEHYFTEDDINYFIKRANEAGKPLSIIEKPGDRNHGYYAVLIMKSKYAKKAIRLLGPGFDTDFDNRLYSESNLMKAVVTRSFVFHPWLMLK